jgi:uncharacterized protein YcbK (DUF882 family)
MRHRGSVCDRRHMLRGGPLKYHRGQSQPMRKFPLIHLPPLPASRRQFLRRAGALAFTLLPATALWARSTATRSLSFVHTHTGERLSSVYFQDGQYVAAELARINYVLRDFRTGDVHPIDPGVLDILSDLRALADRDEGRAIDVRLPGVPTARLRELALGMSRGGVGYYAASDFVHLDNGRIRHW